MSTEEQVAGTSLATQLSRCRSHIEAQGWSLAGEWVDEGVSGAKASRPALDRLMVAVTRGEIDAVVVAKLDRIGRSMRNLAGLMGELDDRGVSLVSISESFDSLTAAGRLQRNMLGSFAEFERAMIRDRVAGGIEATALAGHWPSGVAPFGYRITHAARAAELEIDEVEANVLRTAIDLVLNQRMTTGQAAAQLNAAGMHPRRAARWKAIDLRQLLLQSERLSGRYVWRRPQLGARGAPIVLEIPAIITSEVHNAIQARLAESSTKRTPRLGRYLLTSRIIGACGAPMWGQTTVRGSLMYRCSGAFGPKVVPGERCSCRTVRVDLVDKLVWSEVRSVLTDPTRLLAMAGLELDRAETSASINNQDLAGMDRRIARLAKAAGEQLAKLLGAGLDPMIAQHAIASLNEDLATARLQRERLAAWQASNAKKADRRQRLWELAEAAAQMLPNADMTTKYRVLELLDVRVSVTGWDECARCKGKGSFGVKGVGGLASRQLGQRATPCPECFGHCYIPSFSMAGELPEVPSLTCVPEAEVARWPFGLLDNG